MPLKITVSFEPQNNLVHFDINAAVIADSNSLPQLLYMAFSRLSPEQEAALDTIADGGRATITDSLSEWRHRAHSIARGFKSGHLWGMPAEDCIINWHDEKGNAHDSPVDIPGPADATHALGTTEIHNFLRVADPCYKWKESNDSHVLVQPGQWTFELTTRDDQAHGMGNGHRPARMVAYNADAGPLDMQALLTTSKPLAMCGVDSALAGFFFDVPVPADGPAKDAWYDRVTDGVLEKEEDDFSPPAYFAPKHNAVVASTFYGDGGYPIFAQYNAQGRAIAVAVVTDPHDPLLAQNPYVERMDYDEEDELEP